MSRHREIQLHLESLGDMEEILSSMKTLAMLETRKLGRYLDTQQEVVENMRTIARDFLSQHRELSPASVDGQHLLLVIGSERGFCGDFNERLLDRLDLELEKQPDSQVILVGHKLSTRRAEDPAVRCRLEGATVAEEVENRLTAVIGGINQLQREQTLQLSVISHGSLGVRLTSVLPPFLDLELDPQPGYPARMQLSPEDFLTRLIHHYLFAVLHERFYTSLMAESHRRMEHLEGALNHLGRKTVQLQLKANYLRQEEITEELEEILLGAGVIS